MSLPPSGPVAERLGEGELRAVGGAGRQKGGAGRGASSKEEQSLGLSFRMHLATSLRPVGWTSKSRQRAGLKDDPYQ